MSAAFIPVTSSHFVEKGWQATLDLEFAHNDRKTLLVKRRHSGPLTVQRPFYPEGKVCHVYVLHPPGGIVSGDELTIKIHAGENSASLITAPAANKFYRSSGKDAHQSVSIQFEKNASVEWLPQETIIYEGAQVKSSISVNLEENAKFIGWEILSLGRPASSEGFNFGSAELRWQIYRQQMPIFLEKLLLNSKTLTTNWGFNGHSACGTLLASPLSADSLQAVRQLIGDEPNRGVTLIDELLICRAKDYRTDHIRGFFEAVWQAIRPNILHRQACPPRIWAT